MRGSSKRLERGARLGRYELLARVARGGMAEIWAARALGDRGFERLFAIKVIAPGLREDKSFERMLQREASIVGAIRHPNVCRTHELCDDAGMLFIVMEWVDGSSLRSLLRAGATSERDHVIAPRLSASILADACLGLHAAHELRDASGHPLDLVHRDISPDNILLTRDGVVKVADFGIAKAMSERSPGSLSADFKGKFAYAAPERLSRQPVTRRADLFSVGCVLYQMTVGIQPFDADNELAVVRGILDGELRRPAEVDPGYPEALEAIVMKALAHDPARRYASANELAADLRRFAEQGQGRVDTVDVGVLVRERLAKSIADRDAAISGRAPGAPSPPPQRPASPPRDEADDDDDLPTVALAPGAFVITGGYPAASASLADAAVASRPEPPKPTAPPPPAKGAAPMRSLDGASLDDVVTPRQMPFALRATLIGSGVVIVAGGLALLALTNGAGPQRPSASGRAPAPPRPGVAPSASAGEPGGCGSCTAEPSSVPPATTSVSAATSAPATSASAAASSRAPRIAQPAASAP